MSLMISKEVLEDITEGWAEDIQGEHVIHRDLTERAEDTIEQEEVTVIKGVRRAGKTFILYELFQKYGGLYINFEDERLFDFTLDDFERLYDIANVAGKKILYMDEVQNIEGWEKFVHRVHRKLKVFVTGSNSALLSSDYSKALVGRTRTLSVTPLQYKEFLRFRENKVGRESFLEYMELGGFPRIALTGHRSLAKEYLDRIIYRDILGTEKVMYPDSISRLALYLLSNVGKEFSYRSLRDVCGVKHENTVKEYLNMLKEAFLIDMIRRYHPSLRKQESYGKKVYSVDPAFVHIGKRLDRDHGRVLENIVYLYLQKAREDIYFGKNHKEVDFVICDGLKPIEVLNVTYEAEAESTLEREISSLEYFAKKYDVPAGLVSLYPCNVPEDVQFHLAHRYLEKLRSPLRK